MIKNYLVPIRSPMAALLNNMQKRTKIWTRTDVIREKQAKAKHVELVFNARQRFNPSSKRFAVVTRYKNHYHVVGLGNVDTATFQSLKQTLKDQGYTHVKLGGIKLAL